MRGHMHMRAIKRHYRAGFGVLIAVLLLLTSTQQHLSLVLHHHRCVPRVVSSVTQAILGVPSEDLTVQTSNIEQQLEGGRLPLQAYEVYDSQRRRISRGLLGAISR